MGLAKKVKVTPERDLTPAERRRLARLYLPIRWLVMAKKRRSDAEKKENALIEFVTRAWPDGSTKIAIARGTRRVEASQAGVTFRQVTDTATLVN